MTHSTQLPIIDIGAFSHDANQRAAIAQAVRNALSDCGFMYICGHGIDSALIARAVAEAQRFFATSPHDKQQLAYTDIDTNFGYQGIEVESLDPSNLPDLKEAFTMRNALAVGAHLRHWPTTEFRDVALAFYEAGLAAAHRIMTVLAACLELPSDFFRVRHQGENVTLRFLHYPANLSIKAGTQLGAGEHTDYGSITLLFQDEVGGLEVRGTDGKWHSAIPIANSVLVNTGDLMERWSNGRFRSTLHRVRPIEGNRDRYSMALFVDPDTAVEVECIPSCVSTDRPARYPIITAGEHIRQKIAATHQRPTQLTANP